MKRILLSILLSIPIAVPAAEYVDIRGHDIAVSSKSGQIYVAGGIHPEINRESWIVRTSTNNGKSWSTLDLQTATAGYQGQAKAIAIGPKNEIYVAGTQVDLGYLWTVRKSADNGKTWATVDFYKGHDNAFFSEATDIDVEENGTIWVCGFVQYSFSEILWAVRKSMDGGKTWVTSEQFKVPIEKGPVAIKADGKGKVLVGGAGENGWLLREQSEKGEWATVDAMNLPASSITSLFLDAGGTLYMSGWMTASTKEKISVVRSSKNFGASWTTLDVFHYADGWHSVSSRLFSPGGGRVLYAGEAVKIDDGKKTGFVRESMNEGIYWTTAFEQANTSIMAAALGQKGRLFLTGTSQLDKPSSIWTTWLSADNGKTFTISDSFNGSLK